MIACIFVILLCATCAKAAVLLELAGDVAPGQWADVVLTGPAGEYVLDSGAATTTVTTDASRVTLPILVPSDVRASWPVDVNGVSVTLQPTIVSRRGTTSVEPDAMSVVASWNPPQPASRRWFVIGLAGVVVIALAVA
ncbi:MAG: hypothetical protein AAGK78_13580, partial [Planctomycetota bacterium]